MGSITLATKRTKVASHLLHRQDLVTTTTTRSGGACMLERRSDVAARRLISTDISKYAGKFRKGSHAHATTTNWESMFTDNNLLTAVCINVDTFAMFGRG